MCGFTPQTISSASNLRDAESTERRGSHSEGDRGLLLRGGHRFPPGHRDMDPERRKQSISEKEMEAGGQSGGQSAGPGRRAEGYRRQVRLGTESPAAGGAEEAPSGGWTGGVGGSPGVCPSIPRRRAGRLGAAAPGRRPGPPGSAAGGPSRGQCILRPAACPWNTHCHHCPLHPGASGGPGEEHHHPWPWALPFLLAQARPGPNLAASPWGCAVAGPLSRLQARVAPAGRRAVLPQMAARQGARAGLSLLAATLTPASVSPSRQCAQGSPPAVPRARGDAWQSKGTPGRYRGPVGTTRGVPGAGHLRPLGGRCPGACGPGAAPSPAHAARDLRKPLYSPELRQLAGTPARAASSDRHPELPALPPRPASSDFLHFGEVVGDFPGEGKSWVPCFLSPEPTQPSVHDRSPW